MSKSSKKAGRPFGSVKGKHPTTVNGKKTKIYKRWYGMIVRCTQLSSHIWKYYGGRRVKVCDRWLGRDGFDNFCDDMGPIPKGLTLDRIDNSGNYEPGNCRWASWNQQSGNRRKTGVPPDPKSLRNRAKVAGLPYMAVYLRVKRLGWSEEKALSTPIQPKGRPPGWRKEDHSVEVVSVFEKPEKIRY